MKRRDFIQLVPLSGLGLLTNKISSEEFIHPDKGGIENNNFTIDDQLENKIYIVSNFHPASCGWLDTFSEERNYCCNSYLNHLERVDTDAKYKFVISEVNNLIAIKNFRPEKFIELKRRIQEGRVEAVNASFLECTINLSGGEALVRQGIEGIRWQKEVLNITPQFMWMIDVCGMHCQMAQITKELGLKAIFYVRGNPTQSTMQWLLSPDGSSILGISAGHYSDWRPVYKSELPLTGKELDDLHSQVQCRISRRGKFDVEQVKYINSVKELAPGSTPYLVLGGSGDYSLAPKLKTYPSEFIEQWEKRYPDQEIKFSTAIEFYNQIESLLDEGKIDVPIVRDGWGFEFNAFWIQNPKVKQRFRISESLLSSVEALTTIKSMVSGSKYPSQEFYHGWLQLLLNMDRNTLWGAAAGQVFENNDSWDANDRYNWIDNHMASLISSKDIKDSGTITFFNPCNWDRQEPITIDLPKGKAIRNVTCQELSDGQVICVPKVPSFGEFVGRIESGRPSQKTIQLPDVIDTKFFLVKFDSTSGNIESVIVKSTGKELFRGNANKIIAERPKEGLKWMFGDQMVNRDKRIEIDYENRVVDIKVETGPVVTIVKIRSKFLNNQNILRTIRIYNNINRIDFRTTLWNVPDKTVVSAQFPFSTDVKYLRRGIPYGFTEGEWSSFNPNFPSTTKGITPVVYWSEYELKNKTNIALLDRGLTGREYDNKTALVFLMATTKTYHGYPNPWLDGDGEQSFEYSLYVREKSGEIGDTQKEAFSYNRPFLSYKTKQTLAFNSMLQTSSNLIVEAFRREDDFIEIRMVESNGKHGVAKIVLNLPHQSLVLTDLIGNRKEELQKLDGAYSFKVSPQQIVTVRGKLNSVVNKVTPLIEWDPLVPEGKLKALHEYNKELIGHPPFND